MHKLVKLVSIILSLTCLIVSSCSNGNRQGDGASEKLQPGLHLQAGEKYYYTIINETNTALEVNDQKIKTKKVIEIGIIYNTAKDSAGNILLKLTYDKFHVVLKDKDGEEQVMDAANADVSENLMDKLLKNIKGNSLEITINNKGEILKITGTKEINDKLMQQLSTFDVNEKKQIASQLSQLTGDEFIKNNFQPNFKLFPDTVIYKGESWQRKNVQSGDLPFEADTKYTLNDIDNNIAEISSESKIKNTADSHSNLLGTEAQINITGKQTGIFKSDLHTGMLLKAKTNTQIEGTITVINHEVPVTVEIKKEISTRKM